MEHKADATRPFSKSKVYRNQRDAPSFCWSLRELAIQAPCHSSGCSTPVAQRPGLLHSEARPWLSQTRTRQKYQVWLRSGFPKYGTSADWLETILPESHTSGLPLCNAASEEATCAW